MNCNYYLKQYSSRLKITLWIDWHEPIHKILVISGWTRKIQFYCYKTEVWTLDHSDPTQAIWGSAWKKSHLTTTSLYQCSRTLCSTFPNLSVSLRLQNIFHLVITFSLPPLNQIDRNYSTFQRHQAEMLKWKGDSREACFCTNLSCLKTWIQI